MKICRRVFASKNLINKKLPVMYMYRENNIEDDSSGWVFFSDVETQNYADNPDNICICDIQTIIEIDKDILPFLDSKPGSAFIRRTCSEQFKPVELITNTDFGYVLATKYLVENKLPVGFMYREKGDKNDSGWRFFSGTESQEYVDNPDNIGIYDIQTVLNFDKSIFPYLNSRSERAYERKKDSSLFIMDESFEFSPEGENSK